MILNKGIVSGFTAWSGNLGESSVERLVDWPSNQDVEQHREEDDGHSGGDGDEDHLAALAGDGEGCWKGQKQQVESGVNSFLKRTPITLRHTSAQYISFDKLFW